MATSRRAARKRLRSARAVLEDRAVVTLRGVVRVVAGSQLVAPLSARACVFYDVLAVIPTHHVLGNHTTLFDVHTRKLVPFELLLDDGTAVLVDGDDADLALKPALMIPRPLDREAEFLEAHGLPRAHVRDTSFEEVAVAPGDRVAVHGVLLDELDASGERTYRDPVRRYRLVAQPGHPLTIGPG